MDNKKKEPRNPNQFKTYFDENGRVCTHCGEYKSWDCYVNAPTKKTFHKKASICKRCKREDRRSKGRKKERFNRKKYQNKLKEERPHLWRARNVRSSLMERARKLEMDRSNIPAAEEIEEWLLSQEPLKCLYSGNPVDIFKMNIDHKVPLSRGGENTLDNLCVTEHKMNSAKGQMTDEEFRQLLQLMESWEDGGKYVLMRLRQGFMGKR